MMCFNLSTENKELITIIIIVRISKSLREASVPKTFSWVFRFGKVVLYTTRFNTRFDVTIDRWKLGRFHRFHHTTLSEMDDSQPLCAISDLYISLFYFNYFLWSSEYRIEWTLALYFFCKDRIIQLLRSHITGICHITLFTLSWRIGSFQLLITKHLPLFAGFLTKYLE